jgi:hypothetical protein
MDGEIFAWDECPVAHDGSCRPWASDFQLLSPSGRVGFYAKEVLFCGIETAHINGVDLVVGVETHGIVGHGKEHPREKENSRPTGLPPCQHEGENKDEV